MSVVVYQAFWPKKVLENIGRFTYRSIFWLIAFVFKTTVQLIKVVRLPHLPRVHLAPLLITVYLMLIAILGSFYWFILKDLPRPTDLVDHQPTLSTKIYDRHDTLLFTFYKDQNRTLVSLKDIPQHFKLATLAIEDSQFYQHNGVSIKGVLRSLKQIIFNQELQGGSTITQQLVKNALLTQERTIERKLKELVLSLEVEWLFDKDQILEMYFNQVSYGGTAYGAEQAAQTYFAKSIKEVNLAEAALLAGLPASPTTYSPFGTNPYLAVYREHQVLNRMVETEMIAPQEAELAKEQKIKLAPQYTNIKAPHFVMFVKDLLVQEYGETMVEQGGLEVITSLDWPLQQQVQEIVTSEISQVSALNITNGSALVTNPKTGEILAMVGSRDYWDTQRDGQVNITTASRQPGSAIKPVNYSVALDSGFTAATLIQDSPVTYDIAGSKPYSPVNYDSKWHGPVTLRQALANSYNVPAVKVLASYGVDKMITQGQKLGITTWTQPERYGLSLTLGGAEVKMTDMAVVYGTLANQGLKVNLKPILAVNDSFGKTLTGFDVSQAEPVLNPNIAYLLSDILSDPLARAQAFGTRSYLNIPGHQVAVKTGTTNDKRDNWTIGYTSDHLAAVWVGNNDNSPMSQVASGITGASPIWNKIMLVLLKDQPEHKFSKPENLIEVKVCTLTGQLACSGCPSKTEFFLSGTEPKVACKPEYIRQLQEQRQQQEESRDQILTGTSISQPAPH
ncbi:transglycosylase domain-containing protein [Patescibacteria group bacterium]|nr:transglycosylase domain-containing protein [Patescibacteria group bacterium]